MATKRTSETKEEMQKKKHKTGSQKRLQASKKGLVEAGSAPGQQKLCLKKSTTLNLSEKERFLNEPSSKEKVPPVLATGLQSVIVTDSSKPASSSLSCTDMPLRFVPSVCSQPFIKKLPPVLDTGSQSVIVTACSDSSETASSSSLTCCTEHLTRLLDYPESSQAGIKEKLPPVLATGSQSVMVTDCSYSSEPASSSLTCTEMPLRFVPSVSSQPCTKEKGTHVPATDSDCSDSAELASSSLTCTEMPSVSSDSVEQLDVLSTSEGFTSCSELVSTCHSFAAPDPASTITTKLNFLKSHPIQPSSDTTHVLPFHGHKVYFRPVPGACSIQRRWLSYSVLTKEIFCSTCMAFSSNRRSPFVTGCKVVNFTVYARIQEHENSVHHRAAATAYLSAQNKTDIESLINVTLVNKRKEKVLQNRSVVRRLIDIILCIAKLGIAYRGKDEAAHTLNNPDVNHGNFLELVLLVAKYDDNLQKHVEEAVAKSNKRKLLHPKSKGRGSLVTLLSKTTVNQLITLMGNMVKQKITQEVKEAVKFSVEMDSTQDISVKEQCSLIVRYVKERSVKERLFSLFTVDSTTGENLFNSMKEQLEKFSLSVSNIIGCSFDGAANLSGNYSGVQARIKTMSCNSVYTWCYAHVLNLVITNVTQCVTPVKSFFGLLEKTAVFFSESYKRNAVWTDQVSAQGVGPEKLSKLKKLSDTRWWSKPRALRTLFGSTVDQSKELYTILLYCLEYISESPSFGNKTVSECKSLIHAWTRYETLLISFLFMQIFEIVSPASDYLQTRGLDILQAWRMVEIAKDQINKLRDSFAQLTTLVESFVKKASSTLVENSVDAVIESQLPQKRFAKRKRMPGELAEDEPPTNPLQSFQSQVYYAVIDGATTSMENKFSKNESIIKDISYLDPKRFGQIRQNDIPEEALKTVSLLAEVDSTQLKMELLSFKENYSVLKKPCTAQNIRDDGHEENLTDQHEACENCLTCCYRLLYDYNLQSCAYTNLFAVYKALLTLACTQVSCERVFSKLKIVKSRLRSLIGQDILESLIILNIEGDIARSLIYDDILDRFAHSSPLLKTFLL